MEEEDDKTAHVNEPEVNYRSGGKGRVAIFHSFEEAAEADREFYSSLTSEQRLAIHYQISVNAFAKPATNSRRFSF